MIGLSPNSDYYYFILLFFWMKHNVILHPLHFAMLQLWNCGLSYETAKVKVYVLNSLVETQQYRLNWDSFQRATWLFYVKKKYIKKEMMQEKGSVLISLLSIWHVEHVSFNLCIAVK